MYDDIAIYPDDGSEYQDSLGGEPQPIGEILAELLAQYEQRFPDLNIMVVETPVA